MRLVVLDQIPHRAVAAHGSTGFTVGRLGTPDAGVRVSVATLAAGGVIGRHDAVGEQVLVVLSGEVDVAGEAGDVLRLGPAQAVLWAHGEGHETRAARDALLLLVEGDLGLAAAG